MLHALSTYIKPYRKYLIAAIVCIFAETVLELVIPMIMADIIDTGVASGSTAYIFQFHRGVQMILFALAALALGVGSSRFAARAGQGLGAEIRKAEFAKIQSFSFANTDHFSTSSLVTRLTGDVTTIQNFLSTGLRPACRAPVMMLTSIIVSFTLNARLALAFSVAAPVLGRIAFSDYQPCPPAVQPYAGRGRPRGQPDYPGEPDRHPGH